MPAGAVTARVNRRHEQVLARPFKETLLWARPLRRPLLLTGRVKRCLNLGSYNYLGFAAADEYCTPRVLDTMAKLGWAMCSARVDAGACSRVFIQGQGISCCIPVRGCSGPH